MILSCFGDESSDETQSRVFAIATVMGPEHAWVAAQDLWIQRTGGKEFHANLCESEYANDPDRTKHKANQALYADLANIIASSDLVGYGVAIDLAAFKELFPGVTTNVAYYKCFTEAVYRTVRTVERGGKQAPPPDGFAKVEFTFDRRLETEHNAGVLYDSLANSPEWSGKDRNHVLATKVFFEGSENPRIQIADLVARETMKALDNVIGPVKRPQRKSMTALTSTHKFFFDLYVREYFEGWRAKAEELAKAEKESSGLCLEGYQDWLARFKRRDNWTNRFRYLVWHNANESLNR